MKDLSAHALRKLLIKEVEKFIKCLDNGTLEELQLMKAHLKDILSLLTEKEQQEMAPILWGKSSPDFHKFLVEFNLVTTKTEPQPRAKQPGSGEK